MGYRRGTSTRIAAALLAMLQDNSALYWTESGETDWCMPITFSRGNLPDFNKNSQLATAKGVIIPSSIEGVEHDRGFTEYLDYTISIGVVRNVGTDAAGRESVLDDLISLVEQIQDFVTWNSQQILALPAVLDNLSAEIQPAHTARLLLPFTASPLFDPVLLRNEGIFLSITNFLYHFEKQRTE